MRYALGDLIQVWDEPPDCSTPGRLFKIVGRADDMLIVKGVNVYPAAVQDAILRYQPRVTGYFRIVLDAPGPLVMPPLRLRIEHGERENAETLTSLTDEIVSHCRKTLRIAPAIEWLAPGVLPREPQKTQLVEIAGED